MSDIWRTERTCENGGGREEGEGQCHGHDKVITAKCVKNANPGVHAGQDGDSS